MLPSVLAKQLQQGLADYIETTFPMTNPAFRGSLGRMLKTPDSVFHEPYTAVRLPFRTAENAAELFEAVHPSFAPYVLLPYNIFRKGEIMKTTPLNAALFA